MATTLTVSLSAHLLPPLSISLSFPIFFRDSCKPNEREAGILFIFIVISIWKVTLLLFKLLLLLFLTFVLLLKEGIWGLWRGLIVLWNHNNGALKRWICGSHHGLLVPRKNPSSPRHWLHAIILENGYILQCFWLSQVGLPVLDLKHWFFWGPIYIGRPDTTSHPIHMDHIKHGPF